MKRILFVISLLVLQVSGSFLTDFQGAIANVKRGFGKLIGDVFTDVKDTVHCTISTVEHVLVQNGILNKRSSYKDKCKVIEEPKALKFDFPQNRQSNEFNSKIRKESVSRKKHSTERISLELEKSIKTFNKTVTQVLDNRIEHEILTDSFKYDTNRLREISAILRRELDALPHNIKDKFKKLHLNNLNEKTGESIWGEIKTLNDLQHNSKNTTEVEGIRRLLNKVTSEMQTKTNTQNILDDHELEQIKKELSTTLSGEDKNNSSRNESSVGTEQPLKQSSDNASSIQDVTNNNVKNVELNENKDRNNKLRNDSLKTQNSESVDNSKTVNNAKQIIEESIHTDEVLKNFFKQQHNSFDVFGTADLLNFGRR